jgi:mono/diheme cytochrome c family protein
MLTNKSLGLVLAGILVAGSGTVLIGQRAAAAGEPQQKMEKAPITHSNAASGAQMYKDYCAACHGAAGKGDGPAVPFLKAPPADLTTMAKRNGGTFPTEHAVSALRLGTKGSAHGTSDMPIWGPLFSTQNKDLVELRIKNLTTYLESLQQK